MNAKETIKYLYEHGHIPSHEHYKTISAALNAHPDLLEACRMVNNSIFQDKDGEWQSSRPLELLKTITFEAIMEIDRHRVPLASDRLVSDS